MWISIHIYIFFNATSQSFPWTFLQGEHANCAQTGPRQMVLSNIQQTKPFHCFLVVKISHLNVKIYKICKVGKSACRHKGFEVFVFHPVFLPTISSRPAGIRNRFLSVRWGWFVGLQTHTAAHHTCQSQGPALLSGEREIYQSLPFPLQGLSQIGSMSERREKEERWEGGKWQVCGETNGFCHRECERLLEMKRRRAATWHISSFFRRTW